MSTDREISADGTEKISQLGSRLSVDTIKIVKVQNNVFQTLKDHICQARIPNPSKLKEEENMSAIFLLNSVEEGKQE